MGAGNIVYVDDSGNQRIQRFTRAGDYLGEWGSAGGGDSQFNGLIGIAIDPNGDVYAGDQGNSRIQKFTSTGTFLGEWGSYGIGNGQFSSPSFIAVDALGNVFVADRGNYRIQKFGPGPTHVCRSTWGGLKSLYR